MMWMYSALTIFFVYITTGLDSIGWYSKDSAQMFSNIVRLNQKQSCQYQIHSNYSLIFDTSELVRDKILFNLSEQTQRKVYKYQKNMINPLRTSIVNTFKAQNSKTYKFRHSEKIIPHPEKLWKGGEDACVAHDNLLVVADGVGGWAQLGIDPALYSKRLVQLICQNFYSDKQPIYLQNPYILIQDSVAMNKEVGSCTICVVTLDPDIGILNSAYLGDSIFSVYRNYREILQTHEQQHQFNKPYQVGTEGDNPASALKHHMQLSEGDVIVLGSDGLWDNLSKDQIEGIVRNALTLDFIAEEVALRSYRYSLMGDYNSPFYEKAKKLGINCPKTGKSDDITVVAATVVRIQN